MPLAGGDSQSAGRPLRSPQRCANPAVFRVGLEPIDDTLHGGNGQMRRGAPEVIEQGKETQSLGEAGRPEPGVESMFEWQRKQ